jgi:hypothetical protein
MVVLNDLVEELGKLGVALVRTSISSDTRVDVLDTREDTCFERDSEVIGLFMVLIPDFFSKIFTDERFSSSWENWEPSELVN